MLLRQNRAPVPVNLPEDVPFYGITSSQLAKNAEDFLLLDNS